MKPIKVCINVKPDLLEKIDDHCRRKYYLTRTDFLLNCIREKLERDDENE